MVLCLHTTVVLAIKSSPNNNSGKKTILEVFEDIISRITNHHIIGTRYSLFMNICSPERDMNFGVQ
jgi:hypothetical protein